MIRKLAAIVATLLLLAQPVSAQLSTSGGSVNVSQIAGVSVATAASGIMKVGLTDGTGNAITSTSGNLNVQCANCSGSGASAVDNATVTEGSSTFAPIGGEFQTTPGTVTTGHQAMAAITAHRAVQVSLFDTAGNALTYTGGVLDVNLKTSSITLASNITQFGGTNLSTGTGAGGAGIPRVTISNDSSLAANQSVNVAQTGGVNVVNLTGAPAETESGITVRPALTQRAGTSVSLSAVCLDANINACGANSTASVTLDQFTMATAQFAAGTLAATVVWDYSMDGTTWIKSIIIGVTSAPAGSSGKQLSIALTNPSPNMTVTGLTASGAKQVRVRLNAFTSGSATVQLFANTNLDVFGLALTGQASGSLAAGAYVNVIGGEDGSTNCSTLPCTRNAAFRNSLPTGSEFSLLVRDVTLGYQSCNIAALGTTRTQCQGLTAGERILVYGMMYVSTTASASTVQLQYGTGTACATGTTNLTPNAWATPANTSDATVKNFSGMPLIVPSGNELCATGGSATNTTNLTIMYAIVS